MTIRNYIFLLFIPNLIWAQTIESENKILMSGTADEDRKIKDIGNPVDETSALSENFFLSGSVNYASCTGTNDTLHLTIFPQPTALKPGMLFTFISPLVNDQAVYAELNGSGNYVQLTKKGINPLDTSDLINGQIVSMVYDGSRFQVFSQLNKSCPVGFIKASEEYCIQPIENTAVFFWPAVKNCGKQNARVCSWGEWYYACLNSASLGITDLTNNWEWIDAGGNSLSWTTPATSNTGMQGGNAGSCINIQASIVDTTHNHPRADPKPYRCCYSLIR